MDDRVIIMLNVSSIDFTDLCKHLLTISAMVEVGLTTWSISDRLLYEQLKTYLERLTKKKETQSNEEANRS